MTIPRKEQFSGSLIGQCLGDALGCPVEGMPATICRYYVDEFLRVGRGGSFGRGRYPYGQYTDDSQLARELLESYVAQGQFDPEDYARRIAAIFRERRIVGPGGATMAAARRLFNGVPWDRAGTPPPAAGNGSAMRAGPVGMMFYDNPPRLIQAALDQGRITHQDPRCSAGAVTIAGAVALALTETAIATPPFLEQLAAWAETIEPSLPRYLRQLVAWIALPPHEALHYIAVAGQDERQVGEMPGISPFVTSSVLWSLYAFLRTPDDFAETVFTAIGCGGDVDTTAAMAGAISGAHLGLERLPTDLAFCLTDQGSWGFTALVELAHAAYALRA
jgi:ADP-ribosylglycohydrolase